MAPTMKNPTPSLLRLPAELRAHIWETVLTLPDPIVLRYTADHQWKHERHRAPPEHTLALLRTCKQIASEATLLYYKANTFELHPRNCTFWHIDLARFHRRMREDKFQALGAVVIGVDGLVAGHKLGGFMELASERLATVGITTAWTVRLDLYTPRIGGVRWDPPPYTTRFEIAPVDHFEKVAERVLAGLEESQRDVANNEIRWEILEATKREIRGGRSRTTLGMW